MKRSLQSIFFFVAFWLLFFALCRLVFVLSSVAQWKQEGWGAAAKAFLFALPMDLSTIGYIGVLPLIVWMIFFLVAKVPQQSKIFRYYIFSLIVLVSILTIIDFNIYKEWSSKLNYRAFQMMMNSPGEALASSLSSPWLISLFIGALLSIGGVIFYKRAKPALNDIQYPAWYVRVVTVLVMAGLFVVAIRGGVSTSPLTISSVYYSGNQTLNHAAVNTEWNLLRDVLDRKSAGSNPYVFMKDEEADRICDSLLFVPKDTTIQLLQTQKPNVVLIIMESFTADVVGALQGEKGVAPFLDSLIQQNVLFTNIYASGFRTDIGFISLHTGFPSQAINSILNMPEKARQLPSISTTFHKQGYHTSYYYGGESEFFNFRSFVLSKDYKRLTDIRDFEKKDLNSKWGAHDDVVLKRVIKDLKTEQQPFFSTIMTLSNHEPFEIPGTPKFPGKDLPNKFRSTAYYTDQSLKEFFELASKQSWYNNTLFVLVADHGHRLPKEENEIYMPQRSHIPLIFAGNVIKPEFRGKRIGITGAQGDLAATLLAQLGLDHKEFYWSKNLLNPYTKQFSFSTYDNGFTWVEPGGALAFDNNSRKKIYTSGVSSQQMQTFGQAFLQKVYGQFLKY